MTEAQKPTRQSLTRLDLRVRVSKSSLIVARAVLAMILMGSLFTALHRNGEWSPFLICLALQVVLHLWQFSFALEIAGGVLRYRTLLRGWTEIRLNEIAAAGVQLGQTTYRDKFRPPWRLYIRPRPTSGIEAFDINLKVFRKDDLEVLLAILEEGFASCEYNPGSGTVTREA